jgi:hypothetical protein
VALGARDFKAALQPTGHQKLLFSWFVGVTRTLARILQKTQSTASALSG